MQLGRALGAKRPAGGRTFTSHFRWMASFLILAGVFVLAPAAPLEWGVESVVPVFMNHAPGSPNITFDLWGTQALHQIDSLFLLPGASGYGEEVSRGESGPGSAAFLWSRSVHLGALAAAARVDSSYIPRIKQAAGSLRPYWITGEGLAGFDVLPGPKPPDRYYDDNAWMVLALLDAYDVTRDPEYLTWARQTFDFVLSGVDEKLGGGVYWREQVKATKNTCSTAPAALAALRLYRITREPGYLQTGEDLLRWEEARLLDSDGLYSDNITLDGIVDHSKWSYNSALMIDVKLEMYSITGQDVFRQDAVAIAQAAETRWVDDRTGAIVDDAAFAQHLAEAFLRLARATDDGYWKSVVQRALTFVHDQGSDKNGAYAKRWGISLSDPPDKNRLIDAASAARAYWLLAGAR